METLLEKLMREEGLLDEGPENGVLLEEYLRSTRQWSDLPEKEEEEPISEEEIPPVEEEIPVSEDKVPESEEEVPESEEEVPAAEDEAPEAEKVSDDGREEPAAEADDGSESAHIAHRIRKSEEEKDDSEEGDNGFRKHGKKGGMGTTIFLCLLPFLTIAVFVIYMATVKPFKVAFSIPTTEAHVNTGDRYQRPDVKATLKGKTLVTWAIPMEVEASGDVNSNKNGVYEERYHASLFGLFNAEISRDVRVGDFTAPVITLKGDEEVSIDQRPDPYLDPGCTAADDVDGNLTRKVKTSGTVNPLIGGVYVITYTVSDSSGNEAVATRTVTVRDVQAPVMTMEGGAEVTHLVGETFEDPGCTATDDTDGVIQVSVEGEYDPNTPGTYYRIYKAKDAAGNETTMERMIIVKRYSDDEIVDPGRKIVYLTFDDGPGPYTDKLLDVLADYGAKATFFVTNQFPDYQNEIKREAEEGHTVAIHTYTHDFDKVYTSVDDYFDDFRRMSDVVEKQTGVRPSILRFPGGSSNTVSRKYCEGIMTELTKMCDQRGIRFFDWNVDSNDAGGATTSDEVAENVIRGLRSNADGISIVLQHDIKNFSVEAVEEILDWGYSHGYRFRAITTSTPRCEHTLAN